MKFITDTFMLESDLAEALFEGYAKSLPIIDYHNHLLPGEILADRVFENLTQVWLEGDHYKWRAMRANGIAERFITGDATDQEKFMSWAKTVPNTLRNPLYHWTHLELARYFDIYELLSEANAAEVFESTQSLLKHKTARSLLNMMNVEALCTTDDPADDLSAHAAFSSLNEKFSMLPTFRPDRVVGCDEPLAYNVYLDKLAETAGAEIKTLDDLMAALESRVLYFDRHGCRLSDLGLSQIPFELASVAQVESSFLKVRQGQTLTKQESEALKTYILVGLGRLYSRFNWTQQLHVGALRNTNTRARVQIGADAGFDSISDYAQAESLAKFLDELDKTQELAKTIIYNLNSSQNDVFATMIGNFCDGSIPGKIQYGSGWWFLDQKQGIENQINSLSNMGLLSHFVGMLTDSRSLLSFPRHEYFRRVLCNLVAKDVNRGLIPNDIELVGGMISNICYFNAKNYFNLS